jgi:hypothetical protein
MNKKQLKLTPWFPPDVKPAHVGVYQCRGLPTTQKFQHWNGYFWGGWAADKKAAERNGYVPSMREQPEWRGLAVKP